MFLYLPFSYIIIVVCLYSFIQFFQFLYLFQTSVYRVVYEFMNMLTHSLSHLWNYCQFASGKKGKTPFPICAKVHCGQGSEKCRIYRTDRASSSEVASHIALCS